ESLVAGDVDDARGRTPRQRELGEAEIDRDAALLLLFQPVGVGARQRFDERGLAVIDVSGGTDDEMHQARCTRIAGSKRPRRSGAIHERSEPAADAESESFPGRSARFRGFALMRQITARRPTRIPACGPPRSLSPLKVTTSAPAAIRSATTGSFGMPYRDRSISAPAPRSSITGT